jgi:hypothetical protein
MVQTDVDRANDGQVRVRMPHDSEDKRLRFYGLPAQVKRYEQQTVPVVLGDHCVVAFILFT